MYICHIPFSQCLLVQCLHVHYVMTNYTLHTCKHTGQGRLDGAVCQFEDKDKMAYLKRVQAAGVVNIEMECTALSSLCYQAGMKCAVVCVTLLDRLEGDQVDLRPEDYQMYQTRLQGLVAKFIKSRLGVSHSNAASNSN